MRPIPGTASARAKRSAGPANRPQVTKAPTARKASSLTTDSVAIAATMPSWRSVLSRWRVPKAIVKPASTRASSSELCQPGLPGRAGRGPGEQGIAAGHRLELQRHVGHHADQRDQRDQPGQQPALAVAAGDEVGDRGDAVAPRDADHLAQHRPRQHHRQRRPEVDRQEPDAAAGRAADAAEVGPRACSTRPSRRHRPRRCRSRCGRRRRGDRPRPPRRTRRAGRPARSPSSVDGASTPMLSRARGRGLASRAVPSARPAARSRSAQPANSAAGSSGRPRTSRSASHRLSNG